VGKPPLPSRKRRSYKMKREEISYSIHKENSKISLVTDAIIPLILAIASIFIIKIYIPKIQENSMFTFTVGFMFLIVLISFGFIYMRLMPWKHPFRARWDNKGIVFESHKRKHKSFHWQNVKSISVEGEGGLDFLKRITPLLFIGKFSWNAMFWSIKSGRFWLTPGLVFFHFTLKNGKHRMVPFPRNRVREATKYLEKISSKHGKEKLEVKHLSNPKIKKTLWILTAVAFFATSFMKIVFDSDNSFLMVFFLILVTVLTISTSLFILYLAYRSFRYRKTIVGGLTLRGNVAYLVGLIYLGIGGFVLYLIGLFAYHIIIKGL